MTVEEIVGQIGHGESLTQAYHQIDVWIDSNNVDELFRLAKKLVETWNTAPSEEWRFRGSFERILEGLAFSQNERTFSELFNLITLRPLDGRRAMSIEGLAERIAANQKPDVLDQVLSKLGTSQLPLWQLIVLELVFFDVDIASYSNLSRIVKGLQQSNHPLGILPIVLLEHEKNLRQFMRKYKSGSSHNFTPSNPSSNTSVELIPIANSIQSFSYTEVKPDSKAIAAVANWEKESNGKIESRAFILSVSITKSDLIDTGLARRLILQILGDKSFTQISLRQLQLYELLDILFATAANGGAYNMGEGHVYGRLKTWQSLAGLMRQDDNLSIDKLHSLILEWTWFTLETDHNWYYQVAWDIGIIGISPDGKLLTILLATDTD